MYSAIWPKYWFISAIAYFLVSWRVTGQPWARINFVSQIAIFRPRDGCSIRNWFASYRLIYNYLAAFFIVCQHKNMYIEVYLWKHFMVDDQGKGKEKLMRVWNTTFMKYHNWLIRRIIRLSFVINKVPINYSQSMIKVHFQSQHILRWNVFIPKNPLTYLKRNWRMWL